MCERGFWCLHGDVLIVQLVYSCSLAWALVPVTGGVAGAERLGEALSVLLGDLTLSMCTYITLTPTTKYIYIIRLIPNKVYPIPYIIRLPFHTRVVLFKVA